MMIKKTLVCGAVAVALSLSSALALEVNIYADSTPKDMNGQAYADWWAGAQSAAVNGTFINMANSINPANAGTTYFELEDFAGVGWEKRMACVFWAPNTSIAELQEANFKANTVYSESKKILGQSVLHDNGWDNTIITWTELTGGVVGTFDVAWESALTDIEQDRQYFNDINFFVKWGDCPNPGDVADPIEGGRGGGGGGSGSSSCNQKDLTAIHNWPPRSVPEAGSTLGMAGFALMALGFLGRRLKG
ncbi:MAG: hypothetical protein KA236_01245 [Verrucomicrobia bacterium]|jgi:hypothetical protein|nr:hypothetical protein [Verrucomicrobiota bacterium]